MPRHRLHLAAVLLLLIYSFLSVKSRSLSQSSFAASRSEAYEVWHLHGEPLSYLDRIRDGNSQAVSQLLVLSIVKNSQSWGSKRGFADYLSLLVEITQTSPDLDISLGLLVSDMHTWSDIRCSLVLATDKGRALSTCDFEHVHSPKASQAVGNHLHSLGLHQATIVHMPEDKHLASLTEKTKRQPGNQMLRRRSLAKMRNQLLSHALRNQDFVLWIDSDIISAPADMLPAMLASHLDIISPNSYFINKGSWTQTPKYFDYNVFQGEVSRPKEDQLQQIADGVLFLQRDKEHRHGTIKYLDEFEHQDQKFVELNSIGGTILFLKAAVHRDGVVFPIANLVGAEWVHQGYTGLETEGICWLANFLGYTCWGMPDSVVMHAPI